MTQLVDSFTLSSVPRHAENLRREIRDFLQDALSATPVDYRSKSWLQFDADFSKKLAQHGWVGLTLPKEYGGRGLDAFSRFVLVEEILLAGAPVSAHWIAERQSGPLILRYGSEKQKHFYLPKICSADAFFCIGMSEPNVGSDLASVKSKAVRTRDGWLLNGHKVWTTNGHRCQYMVALVRTSDPSAERHAGLSQFVIDLKSPGVTVRPIRDISGDNHFAEVFFDNVTLDEDALIGLEGSGWAQVNSELAFERSGPERIYSSIVLLEHWLRMLRSSPNVGRHAVLVGRFAAQLTTLRNMSISVTKKLASGESPLTEAALVKDLGTEFEQSVPSILESFASDEEAWSPEFTRALRYVSVMAPTFSLRGGTREILRGMIARGLGLR